MHPPAPPPICAAATRPALAPTPAKAPSHVNWTRALAVGSVIGLIVLGVAWELVLAPIKPGGSLLALKVIPLVFPLAGLLKNRMYTYRWVSLVVWLYFTEGSVRAYSDKAPGNWLAMLEVLLCLVLFSACTLHVRLRQKSAAQLNPTAGELHKP